jgi:hypothetical protein
VPHELSQDERDAIVAYVKSLGTNVDPEEIRSFEFSLERRPPLFVKGTDDILFEASTQHFFYLRTLVDRPAPQVPQVPQVFNAFSSRMGAFMVMEKIDALTIEECGISEEEAVEHAAFAVKWLLAQLPSIPDGIFGRISSKPAFVWHRFFKDSQSPRVFANRRELAEYILKV